MYPSMDEVTSKVAYAYAKQQAGVVGSLALLAAAPGIAWLQGSWEAALLAGLLAAIPGAVFLYITLTTKDLERVGHAAKRVFPAAVLVFLALLAASVLVAPLRPGGARLADLGGLWIVLVATVSYPLPVRRGATVLYRPAAVRRLADRRTVGIGLTFLVGLAALEFLPGGFAAAGLPLAARGATLLALLVAVAGVGLYLLGGADRKGVVPAMAAAAVAAGLLLGIAGDWAGFGDRAGPLALTSIAVAGLIVITVVVLNPRLTTGRRIIAHRA